MSNRLLVVYSTIVTWVALAIALKAQPKATPDTFDTLTVHRLNVVEANGTLRMVISNHGSFPGIIRHGKEEPFERPQAGMLFYNDEGTETGGLIFGGRKNAQGQVVDSGGSLSFDKYDAKQIVQLAGVDDKEDHFSGLAVSDSPGAGQSHQRVWVGRDDSGAAEVILRDAAGRKRMAMEVAPDGGASLLFFDANGKVLKKVVPEEMK